MKVSAFQYLTVLLVSKENFKNFSQAPEMIFQKGRKKGKETSAPMAQS